MLSRASQILKLNLFERSKLYLNLLESESEQHQALNFWPHFVKVNNYLLI